jgi:DNA polymerase III subunit gamma/tau
MSNFVVSARKYRPVRFDEVVGQQHVSQTLKNALQNEQLAHAFLFCGPRGVGKTTCARILAKVLNCQNITEDHEACNECGSCKAFNENASFNITELDAASNNSVDHIRALIEQVRFQPQQGKFKVFIIDEVHMLSQQAFNAFLKTLEEPPPYAIFILATTEKHKIIPTILSRCQIFDFRRIQIADTVSHLQEICKKENIQADKDALHIIAQKADGALRDALSIFDRIVSSIPPGESGRSISYEHVIENLNVLDYDYFFKIVDGMLTESVSEVMLIFDDILKKGFEADIFINGLAEHYRNLLICKDTQTLQLLEVSDSLKGRYKEQAQITPASFILTALNISNDCDVNFKMARNKRLHVEMALIKMTFINRAVKLINLPKPVSDSSTEIPSSPQAEKKTPDQNGSLKKEEPEIEKVIPPVSEVKEDPIPLQPAKESAKIEQPAAKPVLETASVSTSYDTPRLVDLSDLEEELENEIDEPIAEQKEITREEFQKVWNEYAKNIKSPSVRTTISNAEFELKDESIKVTVGSTMAKEMVQQEAELMQFIRDQLGRQELIMEVLIDPDKLPDEAKVKPKKLFSTKEKYDQMLKENPLIDEMRKRFDLKPDYD